MSYFHPEKKTFSGIDYDGKGVKVNDATKDAISASLSSGGDVWIENGQIKTSGAAPSPHHEWKNGKWRINKAAKAAQLENSKASMLIAASEAAQAFIASLAKLENVPQFEKDSWTTQALEAQAWAADNNAPTPVLETIAKARGVVVDELRKRALAKAQAYAILTASVAGQRQAFEDRINAAQTLEELEEIQIAYKPPMMPMQPAGGAS